MIQHIHANAFQYNLKTTGKVMCEWMWMFAEYIVIDSI